jgi:2,5-diketo-D-gluconate reductase A
MTDRTDVHIPGDTLALPGGGAIPLVGFGTWQLKGDDCYAAVLAAFEAGYRHLDTATMYGNETEVGRALAESGLAREDVFLTTKYNPRSGRAELDVLKRSLDALGVDQVDLWLVHAPADDRRNSAIWESFVSARTEGTARDIGVSNFSADQIDHVGRATGVVPAVNQIEWRPPLHDPAVVDAHRSRGVVLEGYSALKGGVLGNPVVQRIADEVDRTAAQVVIRWHVQHDIVVIPRSSKPDRIRANADVGDFELSGDQMAALDGLGKRRR